VFFFVRAAKTCVYIHSVSISFHEMVSEILEVVGEYVKQLQGMSYVPPFSFERGLYRDDGGPNRLFFTYLFCDKVLANLGSQGYPITAHRDRVLAVSGTFPYDTEHF